MSLCTLPIMFFNLGGEMLYILDQRLKAQKVGKAKSEKVMRDIVGQMLDSRCVKEIFRPQKVLTKKSLRTVFERLAHASIMKLNSSAMDKLYDLMVMAIKYQLLLCRRGEDVILVSFNHLDTIRELVGDSESHVSMVDHACRVLADFYGRFTPAQFVQLRCTLLSIFQDTHKRVSIFLKTGAQLPNGRFSIPVGGPVPNGFEVPGTIRYFDVMGLNVKLEEKFSPPHHYGVAESPGTWDVKGNRGITLGLNVYRSDKLTEAPKVSPSKVSQGDTSEQQPVEEEKEKSTGAGTGDAVVNAELHLLERLLGRINKKAPTSEGDSFHLRLFSESDDEEEKISKKSAFNSDVNVVEINPSKKGTSELDKIMKDFTIQGSGEGGVEDDDLLDLMDNLS